MFVEREYGDICRAYLRESLPVVGKLAHHLILPLEIRGIGARDELSARSLTYHESVTDFSKYVNRHERGNFASGAAAKAVRITRDHDIKMSS